MAQVLCFARNRRRLLLLADAVLSGGHCPVRCRSVRAALRRMRTIAIEMVVVEYRRGDLTLVKLLAAAKSVRNIPVIVISSRITAAFQLCRSLGDLYLEEPVRETELAFFVDLLTAESSRRTVGKANERLVAIGHAA